MDIEDADLPGIRQPYPVDSDWDLGKRGFNDSTPAVTSSSACDPLLMYRVGFLCANLQMDALIHDTSADPLTTKADELES